MYSVHSLLNRVLLLSAFALMTGCTNTDPTTGTTTVAGQVVESQSQKPVGRGTVQVYTAKSGGGFAALGSPHPCDANGNFAFDFEGQAKESYILMGEAPPGYATDWAAAPYLTPGRKNQNLVVSVLAPAWVRLILIDEAPKSQAAVNIQGYEGPGDSLNPAKDTTFVRPTFAGFKTSIAWWIYYQGQGQNTHSSQQIQPRALDTVTVRISF